MSKRIVSSSIHAAFGRAHQRKKKRFKTRRRIDRAIAYVRVSSERQIGGPGAQRNLINEWALRTQCEVLDWFEDHLPGYFDPWDRPALLRALVRFEQSDAGLFVFAQRDRLARDPEQMRLLQRVVEAHGGRLVAANGVANGEGPFEDFLRLLLDGVAGLERAMTGIRTRAVFQVRRSRGEACANLAPFGFIREGRILVPNPDEQAILHECARLRELGYSLAAISVLLKEKGLRGRKGYLRVGQLSKICVRVLNMPEPRDFTGLDYKKISGAQNQAQVDQRLDRPAREKAVPIRPARRRLTGC